MGLFRRGQIFWASFYISGRRRQLSTGTSNRRRAEQIFSKLKEQANLNRFQIADVDSNLTFEHLAEKFKSSNPSAYNLDRLKHLLPFFGPMLIVEITKAKTQLYRDARKQTKQSLKDATLNRDLGVLRHILNWAVEQQTVAANPLNRLSMVRERRTKRPVMSVRDEELLLNFAPSHLRRIVIAALDSGMRRGELLCQRWEDVDLDRKVLFVSKSKTPEGEGREIPLTSRLFAMLLSMHQGSGFVFTYRGLEIQDLKTSWNTAQKKAYLHHYRFHDLRHTFSTRLMEAGVISDVRKALMGHQDRSVHAGYTHVELPAKRQAISKLEAWINAQKDQQESS